MRPNSRTAWNRARETHLIEAVVHRRMDVVDFQDAGPHGNQEGKRQIAVSDRLPERPVLGAVYIHVDPLMVVGGMSEAVDPRLIDVDPRAGTEFFPDERSQVVESLNSCRHWVSFLVQWTWRRFSQS